jgi:hypothetical protein
MDGKLFQLCRHLMVAIAHFFADRLAQTRQLLHSKLKVLLKQPQLRLHPRRQTRQCQQRGTPTHLADLNCAIGMAKSGPNMLLARANNSLTHLLPK